MTDGRLLEKDLEGSGSDAIDVITRNFPEGTE
jgi:hypothetical protein